MIKLGRLTKNSLYTLLGNGLPFIIGLVTIPRLVHVLGTERFGVLTLNWAVLGYFSLFDLGLGRALTQIVAERTGIGDLAELPDVIRTALDLMLGLGVFGGLVLVAVSPVLMDHAFKMTPALKGEVWASLLMTAACVPAVTLLAGVRGILEGRQRFLAISLLRLGMGILTFLGPWLVSFKTPHLFWVIGSLFLMRYAALLGHHLVARHTIPEMRLEARFRSGYVKMLAKFGGWMTVSNLISPLMVNFDRFFIGTFLSLSAVTFYSAPFEIVTKLLIISGALVSVLFPVFGALHRTSPEEARRIYWTGLKVLLITLAPTLFLLGWFAPKILSVWLGAEFALQGASVMRVLCAGVLVNSLAAVPFAFTQGLARPDLTAKCHMFEVPIYAAVLWFLGSHFGIIGVAWAWTLRVTLDLLLLVGITHHLQGKLTSPAASLEPLG